MSNEYDENEPSQFGADAPGTVTIPEVTIQPYPTIKKGSRGPTVAKWQRMIGVTADGNFGSGTDTATRKWQSDHNLTPDGVVGVQSWAEALKTTSPTGMLALEWNQASPEIPAPPAPANVIPPVVGSTPLYQVAPGQPATGFAQPSKVASVVQAPVATQEASIMGSVSALPLWAKVLGILGLGGVAVYYGNEGKKKNR